MVNGDKAHKLLDATMRGWIVNTARQQYWRVASWYDLDDLIQEGYLSYAKCLNRYGSIVDDLPTDDQRKQFMALVKTIFTNRIIDLSNSRTRSLEETFSDLGINEPVTVRASDSFASISIVLEKAPQEIKQLAVALVKDFVGYREIRVKKDEETNRLKRLRRPLRETRNDYWCRLIGVDPRSMNLAEQVRQYFAV